MTSTDTTDPNTPEASTDAAVSAGTPVDEFAGYDDLPTAATHGRIDGPGAPRFDGDVSAMPDRACWALQNLLTRRHVSGDRNPQLWAWVTEYQDVLRSRLSELDLRLRLVDELQVAFVEQAGYDSRWGRKILKRETIHTYDAILALHQLGQRQHGCDAPVVLAHFRQEGAGALVPPVIEVEQEGHHHCRREDDQQRSDHEDDGPDGSVHETGCRAVSGRPGGRRACRARRPECGPRSASRPPGASGNSRS